MTEPTKVKSSNIHAIGFDNGTLTVHFKNGGVYDIPDVPEDLHKQFMDDKFEKENHTRPLNADIKNPAMSEEQKTLIAQQEKFKKDMGLTGKKTYAH